ncbi:MAG: XdhC/CoxI family protein [Deltaproteobacteria bacterium]|nr:XdhC/CoxI family protein [Deltaproteobacteria bacterium]
MWQLLPALRELVEGRQTGALATVVRASGSAPQKPGARLLLREDGSTVGTVGGGTVEARVLEHLEACLRTGKAGTISFDLVRDLGMCCGGSMEVFMERIEAPDRLVLFGAGHVAQPTASLARSVGFAPVIVDEREDWNTPERFPGAEHLLLPPAEAVERLALRDDDWILIMTHEHRQDEEVLELCLPRPHRYLGMIGSKRKVFQTLQRIAARGPLPELGRLHAPIGAPLGAVGPEEIAVSIVSELIALRRGAALPGMSVTHSPRLQQVLEGALSPTDAAREEG